MQRKETFNCRWPLCGTFVDCNGGCARPLTADAQGLHPCGLNCLKCSHPPKKASHGTGSQVYEKLSSIIDRGDVRCRRGDAPVVADLLTAAVWVGEVGYARDVVALLIAKG